MPSLVWGQGTRKNVAEPSSPLGAWVSNSRMCLPLHPVGPSKLRSTLLQGRGVEVPFGVGAPQRVREGRNALSEAIFHDVFFFGPFCLICVFPPTPSPYGHRPSVLSAADALWAAPSPSEVLCGSCRQNCVTSKASGFMPEPQAPSPHRGCTIIYLVF